MLLRTHAGCLGQLQAGEAIGPKGVDAEPHEPVGKVLRGLAIDDGNES
jgi:hypothetical protein